MDPLTRLPDAVISPAGPFAETFLGMGVGRFHEACRWVHRLPYGYNSNKDDPMILFKEKMGSCTTKHAVIGKLAIELGLPVTKTIGIYAMTEVLVTGTQAVLEAYRLPYVPMIHCFLTAGAVRVYLTEGNRNGKKPPHRRFSLHPRRAARHLGEGRIPAVPAGPLGRDPPAAGAFGGRSEARPPGARGRDQGPEVPHLIFPAPNGYGAVKY
jgi:hypothetical protein